MPARLMFILIAFCFAASAPAQMLERPTPSTQPAMKSMADVVALIPEGIVPTGGRPWNNAKAMAVQQSLAKAAGRQYRGPAIVVGIQRDRNDISILQLQPAGGEGDSMIVARIYGMDLIALARMDVGDRIEIEGTITRAQMSARTETTLVIQVDLEPASIVGKVVKGEPPATRPARAAQ